MHIYFLIGRRCDYVIESDDYIQVISRLEDSFSTSVIVNRRGRDIFQSPCVGLVLGQAQENRICMRKRSHDWWTRGNL